jgi:hypothetical protein
MAHTVQWNGERHNGIRVDDHDALVGQQEELGP